MSRYRARLAVLAVIVAAAGFPAILGGSGVAGAKAKADPSIDPFCPGNLSGTTYTLTADCGPTTAPITVPSTISTVNGNGHTVSATDLPAPPTPEFNGAILTNESAGQTMNIENLTVSGPATGFQICTNSNFVLYGILFNDAGGSVSGVTVEHIWQGQTTAPSCQTGTAIRAEGVTAARTVTITNTKVLDYQKNGIDGRGTMTMNVTGSTMGPPHPAAGLIAQNGLVYVNAAGGTATNNTIFGSGDQQPPGPPGGGTDGTAVILFGAKNVVIDHNVITSDPSTAGTDIGIAVTSDSTGIVLSFNQIGRVTADDPDPTGHGIHVDAPSKATLICNTFSNWRVNIFGAVQIDCTPLPPGTECDAYSAPILTAQGGTLPYHWSVASGTLPPGLSLASAGGITGTPTATGTFNFSVRLVDSTPPPLSATQAKSITIAPDCAAPAPPITPIKLPVTG
jgi:hypothetical protein